MDEQLTLLLVLAVAVIGLLAFVVIRDRSAQSMADALARQSRENADRSARNIAELVEAVKESNLVLRGVAGECLEKFWAYDPNAREMARIKLETDAMNLQMSDTRARYRNGHPATHTAGANGTAAAAKTAERFSDTDGGTL